MVVRNKAYKQIRWSYKYKTKQNNMDQENNLELQNDWSDLMLYTVEVATPTAAAAAEAIIKSDTVYQLL